MKNRFVILVAASLLSTVPVHAETRRDKLLEIVEVMGNTLASKQALRPLVEKATTAQISAFDRGLYFEEIGDDKTARKYYEAAVAVLDPNAPGKDAWCVAYKLLRIPEPSSRLSLFNRFAAMTMVIFTCATQGVAQTIKPPLIRPSIRPWKWRQRSVTCWH